METVPNLSIFLVDDDKLFLKSLEHHLQHRLKYNIRIRSFPTGEECLKYMHQKPNIVILDYILNSNYQYAMNGIDVLHKLKETDPDLKVIMISGQEKMNLVVETLKTGAYDYVYKGTDLFNRIDSVIKDAINAVIETRKAHKYEAIEKAGILILALIITAILVIKGFKS